MSDLISRQQAIEALLEKGQSSRRYILGEIWELNFDEIREVLNSLSPAQPKNILCKDCIYYDPPHIEHDGQRYEYKDMPPEAFDPFTEKYVNSSYGINVGGRCCRDYERGYSEDKRVYVPETNYCGRAERKEE